MVTTNKKRLDYVIGKECILIFTKNYVHKVTEMEFEDLFIRFKRGDETYIINKQRIDYIKYSESTSTYLISVSHETTTRGIINQVDGKFITIDVHNINNNAIYTNIVPVKCVKGIKVLDENGDDDDIVTE